MRRRTFFLLGGILALAGCVAPESPYSYAPPTGLRSPLGAPRPPGYVGQASLSQMSSGGRGVALLAPLTGPNAPLGEALANAAKLALSTPGAPPLDVRDTGGTPQGAAAAASAAIAAGAGLIIGPLTTGDTAAAAVPARSAGVPMLAFTSDVGQAQPGVWVLGLTPAQQVRRSLASAIAQGKQRVGAVLPESDFGHAVAVAIEQAVASGGLPAADIRFHNGSVSGINSTVRDISGYASRRGPLDAQIRAARARHDAEGRRLAAELVKTPIPPAPIDVLVLADTGERLATLASLLAYYDLDPPGVQVIGPALWAAPQARADARLPGAWYAAPDPGLRADFTTAFEAAYGTPASSLADFAFDAASIARVLAAEGRYSVAGLCRPEGFAGVDGVLALQTDGTVRRGLALFRIGRGAPQMAEPPPDTTSAPGF